MPIPTHDIHCVTKSYEMPCPDCTRPVQFFSCSCGSKVFFDHLGDPWPQHRCIERELREHVELLRNAERLTDQEIFDLIDKKAEEDRVEVPQHVITILDDLLRRRGGKLRISEITDLSLVSDISGQVIDMNTSVNFRSRFKIDPSNPIAIKLAGDLLKHEFVEIVIRTKSDKRLKCNQYMVFLRKPKFLLNRIRRGDSIIAELQEIKTGLGEFWEIRDFVLY